MAISLRRTCRCSHDKAAHEHYRSGSDCAQCDCVRYRFGFVLTLSLGTPGPVAVSPEVIDEVAGPYVRPSHANLRNPAASQPVSPPLPRSEATPDPAPKAAER